MRGYVEFHLEQGPVLETSNKPLGVVSAIAGQTRLTVSLFGTQVRGLKTHPVPTLSTLLTITETSSSGATPVNAPMATH